MITPQLRDEQVAPGLKATCPSSSRLRLSSGAPSPNEDLAAADQLRIGCRTRMLLASWIGQVLKVVLRPTLREGLPPLTAPSW